MIKEKIYKLILQYEGAEISRKQFLERLMRLIELMEE